MMKKRYTFHCLLWVLGLISPTLLPGQESASDSPSKLSAESLFARDQLIDVEIELKKEDWDLLRMAMFCSEGAWNSHFAENKTPLAA